MSLVRAIELTFFARGGAGGERITFVSGGITGPYGDSMSKHAITVDLTTGRVRMVCISNGQPQRRDLLTRRHPVREMTK